MAWKKLSNAFTTNFELDLTRDAYGSDWRAQSGGWGNVEITLYSSSVAAVPIPAAA